MGRDDEVGASMQRLKGKLSWIYPEMELVERGAQAQLRGEYPVVADGKVIDRFSIAVEFCIDAPRGPFTVREVGGRIPHNQARHVESNGTACVVLPDAFWFENPGGMDLIGFLGGPVRDYYFGQSLVERGEPWPFGEWGHGAEGVQEFYREKLGVDDGRIIARLLDFASRPKPPLLLDCPCGSRKLARACHGDIIAHIHDRIPREVLQRTLKLLSPPPKVSSRKGYRPRGKR